MDTLVLTTLLFRQSLLNYLMIIFKKKCVCVLLILLPPNYPFFPIDGNRNSFPIAAYLINDIYVPLPRGSESFFLQLREFHRFWQFILVSSSFMDTRTNFSTFQK